MAGKVAFEWLIVFQNKNRCKLVSNLFKFWERWDAAFSTIFRNFTRQENQNKWLLELILFISYFGIRSVERTLRW